MCNNDIHSIKTIHSLGHLKIAFGQIIVIRLLEYLTKHCNTLLSFQEILSGQGCVV